MNILHKITREWQRPWIITWLCIGIIALLLGVREETGAVESLFRVEHRFVLIKFIVAVIGMLCVVALAFRKNFAGNGLGITANIGEIFAQGKSGATGLMLAPIFYLSTHIYALFNWKANEDGEGNMIPRSAGSLVWGITIVFIIIGLLLFPWLNEHLSQYRFIDGNSESALTLAGISFSWYQINIAAFVLGVSAQTAMILRYNYSWWLWFLTNILWLTVNIMNKNYIFAAQTMLYQINTVIGIYEWYSSARKR